MLTADWIRGVIFDHAGVKEVVGTMKDQRISRQVWLGYVGGKNVSSEKARESIVDGILELVERPLGTV